MFSLKMRPMLFAGAFLALAGGTARADFVEVMRAQVPFPFVVHGRTLPAGQYLVERDDTDQSLMFLQGRTGTRAAVFVETIPAVGRDVGAKPTLSFTRSDNQYHLTAIEERGADEHVVQDR